MYLPAVTKAARALEALYRDAVGSIDLASRVARALRSLDPPLPARVLLVAAGKSAPAMAQGALRVVQPAEPPLIVTVLGTPSAGLGRAVRHAGHPVPDEGGVRAAEAALAMAARAGRGRPLLFLVSGGASSLLCAPIEGLTLDAKRRVVAALVGSGLPIERINALRSQLSRIKGGRLAAAAGDARVVTVVASDVLAADDVAVVGSGPTTGPEAPRVEALRVAGPEDLARAARRLGRRLGVPVFRLPAAGGSVEELALRYAAIEEPGLHVGVGEPTVVLPPGCAGQGGRSQHLALLVARAVEGRRVTFLAAGSDGIDGASSAAGAVVDGATWSAARRLRASAALARHDSGRLAARLGAAIVTGPTGVNLLDLHLLWVDPSRRARVYTRGRGALRPVDDRDRRTPGR